MAASTLLVCGSRDYLDDAMMFFWLDFCAALLASEGRPVGRVVHGAARGADSIAGAWSRERLGIVPLAFPADWNRYGNRAGPIRNGKMIRATKPDLVVAAPGGNGTQDCLNQAKEAGHDTARFRSLLQVLGQNGVVATWEVASGHIHGMVGLLGGPVPEVKVGERISNVLRRFPSPEWEARVDSEIIFTYPQRRMVWTMQQARGILGERCPRSEPSPRPSSTTPT